MTTADQPLRVFITHFQPLTPPSNAAETRPTCVTARHHHNHRPSPHLSLCLKCPLPVRALYFVGIVEKKVTRAADAKLLEPRIEHHVREPPINSITYTVTLRTIMVRSL